MKKPAVFCRALPTKPYRTGRRGIFKGGVPPLTRGLKGRSPSPLSAFWGLQDAQKCILWHRIWYKLCCLLTWTPPGFYASVGGATRHTVVRRFVLLSFCPQAELRVGGKLSADTCNTCSTLCCLGIELIDFWFQSFVTLNGIAGPPLEAQGLR